MSDQGIFPLYIKGGLFEEEKKGKRQFHDIYTSVCTDITSAASHQRLKKEMLIVDEMLGHKHAPSISFSFFTI